MLKITLDDHIGMLLLAWLPSTVIVFGIFVLTKREDCYMAIGYFLYSIMTIAAFIVTITMVVITYKIAKKKIGKANARR